MRARLSTCAPAGILLSCFALAAAAAADATIDFPSVSAALDALRADAAAQFESQDGWTIVASVEHGDPVLWSFTPEGHPAHPAVVKRAALEEQGEGFVQLTTLCQGPEPECIRLLEQFKQINDEIARSNLAKRVVLDVGIAQNARERVLVKRLLAEEGKAAEIRLDNVLKVVIVPSWDELRGVLLWTAAYEHDGRDYRLAARPTITAPGTGTAQIDVTAFSGDRFRFSITSLALANETGL